MNNPFEIIDARLSNIENLLLDLKANQKKDLPKNHSENFISRKTAARILNISLTSLNTYCKAGLIKSYRLNSRVLLKESEIIESVSLVKSVKYKKGETD